jgi:hypothetical protein
MNGFFLTTRVSVVTIVFSDSLLGCGIAALCLCGEISIAPGPYLQFTGRISDNRMLVSTLGRPAPCRPASRRVSASRCASTPAVRRVVQCNPRVVIPNHDPFDRRFGKIRKIRKPDLEAVPAAL